MPQITSQHNQRLKEIRKLRMRRRERSRVGRFVAEGEDLLAAADAAGWTPIDRYVVAGSGLEGVEVEAKVLNQAAGLASGTRALAVYEERWAPAAIGPLCVYLHGVHDPGNVGAVLRSAEAFGASCVGIGPGTADPFSPKAVRASMGAVFGVRLARVDDVGSLPGTLIALEPGAGAELSQIGPGIAAENAKPADLTVLVGAERDGLPEAIVAQADHVAHIPIRSQSLNAAMAATVALYELSHRMRAQ
jgi:TrmH family RNA methyltransferase